MRTETFKKFIQRLNDISGLELERLILSSQKTLKAKAGYSKDLVRGSLLLSCFILAEGIIPLDEVPNAVEMCRKRFIETAEFYTVH